MQTLKDTATLVALILLALTFQVNVGGEPVELDLSTPAEASTEPAPADPSPATLPASGCNRSEGPKQLGVVHIPRFEIETANQTERQLVWEMNGKRIVVHLDTEGTAVVETPRQEAAPLPCNETIQAQLSS